MKTKVSRWGNSLALRIPKKLASSHQIMQGSDVEILEREDGLLLRSVPKKTYSLGALLDGVTESNRHKEISPARPVGKEIW